MAEQPSFFIVEIPRARFELSRAFYDAADLAAEGALRFFESIEEKVYDAVYQRMRDGGGFSDHETERENLQTLTVGGDNPRLVAFGTLVQTFVDEFGMPPQTAFPPFGPDSLLYAWVASHLDVTPPPARRGRRDAQSRAERQDKVIQTAAFLVARAIWERGLPNPDDELRAPFATTFREFLPEVTAGLEAVGFETAQKLNGVGVY